MPPRSPRHAAWGLAIRELRAEAGYSQDRLALDADVNRQFLGKIERGEGNPSLSTLFKLADTIGSNLTTIATRAEHLAEQAATKRR